MDRLIHKSKAIDIQGDSYRLKEAKERETRKANERASRRASESAAKR